MESDSRSSQALADLLRRVRENDRWKIRNDGEEAPEDSFDGSGPSGVDAKDSSSSAGKRYVEHDRDGLPRRMVWVSGDTEKEGKLGAMGVKHVGGGKYQMTDYGSNIAHSQIVSNLKSGKWTFHGNMKRSVLPPGA